MMIGPNLGDMARYAAGTRTSTALRSQLSLLSGELTSGRHADPARVLGADIARVAGLDRHLTRADAFATAARATGQFLTTAQIALDAVADSRQGLADRLMTLPLTGTDTQIRQDAAAGRGAFSDIVAQLNSRMGDSALFAGTATTGAALAPAAQMLAALETAVAGASTAPALVAAVDAWFAPGGGFDTTGYLGDTGPAATRSIDAGETVALSARADDPAVRAILRGAALAAMADAPAITLDATARTAVLTAARDGLISAGDGLTDLRSAVGRAEEQVDTALARHAARATAWGIQRTDLLTADPYATATRLKAVETQLDTHLTLTARLSTLTLTRYLR